MVVIISSAKTMDFTSYNIPDDLVIGNHIFYNETQNLLDILRNFNQDDLQKILNVSKRLADCNFQRFQNFKNAESKMAIFAYKGDVYKDINPESFNQAHLEFLQSHFLIISGLYGLLYPLNMISPYRLEMQAKIPGLIPSKLSQYWKELISKFLNQYTKNNHYQFILNLASKEYSSVLDSRYISVPVININFRQQSVNQIKNIGIFAKKARGLMSNFIVRNKITDLESIKKFHEDGYRFVNRYSDSYNLTFIRPDS
ncbi:YaaA family protein [Rickettsia endosymbiont of Cardiosporidium cionae]|uniref:YaaA family protein n=1 Tax=Rickettsia endosymbiont of Cardiosporidium cionae TaxID=2777155 RepID=UPI001894E796|nr:YaaA family protein [Rickettsia endosymbiont of Cardiosporidium cionae]KAF8818110.1 peroxide stress protein YaaA [Rickettsia endosymbiont of Cardiosporidium cionae]